MAAPARAAGEVRAEKAARAAFEAGRALAAAGDYEEACRKFEESIAFVDAIGTTYNLADCEEHRGHLARAQSLFSSVAERAHELDQPEREQAARERASALDAKLSLLAIDILAAPGAAVSLDGEPLSAEAIKAPIPLEPGKHRLTASADGKRSWSKQIDIPRAQLLVTVAVPKLEEARPRKSETVRTRGSAKPPAPSPPGGAGQRQRSSAPALVLAGIGVGATAAGGFFGWRYLSSNSDAKALCPSGYGCRPQQIAQHAELVDRARASRNFSYVGFGVGAAALTSAAVLYFTSGSEQAVSATVGGTDGTWAATLRGRF